MPSFVTRLDLAEKTCRVATGKSFNSRSIVHLAACDMLVEAHRPLSLADLCGFMGYDFSGDWTKGVLFDLAGSGLITKVRKPPSVNNPKGSGHRYLASSQLKMAWRFLASDTNAMH